MGLRVIIARLPQARQKQEPPGKIKSQTAQKTSVLYQFHTEVTLCRPCLAFTYPLSISRARRNCNLASSQRFKTKYKTPILQWASLYLGSSSIALCKYSKACSSPRKSSR